VVVTDLKHLLTDVVLRTAGDGRAGPPGAGERRRIRIRRRVDVLR